MQSKKHEEQEHEANSWIDLARLFLVAAAAALGYLGFSSRLAPFDVLSVLAVIMGGYPVWKEAAESLKSRSINTELGMGIGALAAFAIQQFYVSAVIIFFTLLSEYLEAFTVERGRHAIDELLQKAPRIATVRREGKLVEVAADDVMPGEVVVVKPGGLVPVDGSILKGSAFINEAPITGESLAKEKHVGDRVFAGTVNGVSVIEVQTESVGADTTYGRIISMIEEAERTRAPVQRVADLLATRLILAALVLAALTFFVTRNLVATVSVIVVTGSCGVAAGTPLAILASIGKAARKGIIVKGGVHLEQLSKVDTVIIDKTGTLTEGRPRVVDVERYDSHSEREILTLAASAEQHSGHPFAAALEERAEAEGLTIPEHSECEYIPGRGITCLVEGATVDLGNLALMREEGVSVPSNVLTHSAAEGGVGTTTILLSHNKALCGSICLSDVIRPESREAIAELGRLGVRVMMLTGDNEASGRSVASKLGIPEVYGNMLPQDKLAKVRELKKEGRRVAMVGDGINDGPALAEADVGIAMGRSGTAVAVEAADVALMKDDLRRIAEAIRISKQARSTIMTNFVGTLGVDGVGVVLAFVGVLNPLLAAAIHVFSELAFIGNSTRLVK
jgi:P-type Cu+ transporter